MTKYSNGANFERRVKKLWEKKDYLVIRSAGSRGIADLVALKSCASCYEMHAEVFLIQCKLHEAISQSDRNVLSVRSDSVNAIGLVAYSRGKEIIHEYAEGGIYDM